jgi:predicted transcriptional regulator
MNKRLETLLERVSTWPEEAQAELAWIIEELEWQYSGDVYQLSEEENVAIDKALAAADRGEFATDEEMAALFKRHGA